MSDPQNPSRDPNQDRPQKPPEHPGGSVPGPGVPLPPGYPGRPDPYAAPNPYAAPTHPGATAYSNPGPHQGQGQGQPGHYPPAPAKQPILSIVAMVAGILGIVGFPVVAFIPIVGGVLGLFIPAAAVVLGFLGKSKEPRARGFWLTGIITGFVGLALAILDIILWSVVLANLPYSTY